MCDIQNNVKFKLHIDILSRIRNYDTKSNRQNQTPWVSAHGSEFPKKLQTKRNRKKITIRCIAQKSCLKSVFLGFKGRWFWFCNLKLTQSLFRGHDYFLIGDIFTALKVSGDIFCFDSVCPLQSCLLFQANVIMLIIPNIINLVHISSHKYKWLLYFMTVWLFVSFLRVIKTHCYAMITNK